MYFSEFKKVIEENTEYPAQVRAIIDAADKYYISRYGQQANVMQGEARNVAAAADTWTFDEILDAAYPTLGRGKDWAEIAERLKAQRGQGSNGA